MANEAFTQILGVPEGANAAALLGLTPAAAQDPVRIEAALRERLLWAYQHPEGRGEGGNRVREALRRAADELKQRTLQEHLSAELAASELKGPHAAMPQRRRPAPVFNLTPLDRMVMAVLVASGGWNAQSRARLVGLASTWGVTVQGLMRVVQGLSEYARAGGTRLGLTEITAGQAMTAYVPYSPPGPPVGPALLDRLTENLSAELKRDDPWPTIKLAAVFGTLTLAAGIIGVRIAFKSNDVDPAASEQVEIANAAANRDASSTVPMAPPPQPAAESRPKLAAFPQFPTFLGNSLPPEALAASSQFATLPAHLDDLIRKLAVEDIPSEAVYRNWEVSIQAIATGWTLADLSTRQQINSKLFEALRSAGDRPTVSDRLLNALTPPKTVHEPLSIWRGAWQVGTLMRISEAAAQSALPPVVTERARAMLQECVGEQTLEERTFESAAGLWLGQIIPQLVAAIEIDEHRYDYWELWLAAQRALGLGDRHDSAIADALEAVLATPTDLSRPGPTVNVVARLLTLALESRSEFAKQRLIALFDADHISSRDLWVLTSLIATSDAARWFPDRLVLPDDADQRHRWRVRDELAMVWPETQRTGDRSAIAQGRPLLIDQKVATRWNTIFTSLTAQAPAPGAPALAMRELLLTSRMVEAGEALESQDSLTADRILDDVDAALQNAASAVAAPSGRSPVPRQRIGTAVGMDGEWARGYQDVGRNPEQRIQHLQGLRGAGSDLGPLDADVFVREVYRGSPQEVRTAAQEIISKFNAGPVVAMAMLDQFGDAPANETISRVIAEFTSQPLPTVRGAGAGAWTVEARLALLNHALSLQAAAKDEIDSNVELLIQSYQARLTALKRDPRSGYAADRLEEIARILAQAWLDRAEVAVVSSPVPANWQGLQRFRSTRLRLAEGPLQKFVAHQLTLLDALTYMTVAEQPGKRAVAVAMLRESSAARDKVTNVLEQAVQTERAVARMWKLRLSEEALPNLAPDAHAEAAAGAPNPVAPSAPPTAPAAGAAGRPTDAATLAARLEALQPTNPSAYFELAEEVADSAGDPGSRAMARHLFGLAGVLDPDHLGRSACLALADLETDVKARRRLRALASLLGSDGMMTSEAAMTSLVSEANLTAAVALGEAFGQYRRGQGPKAAEALRKAGASELLQQIDHLLPGGAAKFIDDIKHHRGQSRPALSGEHLARMLRLEIAMLSGGARSWSSDWLLTGGKPLIEVDPTRLQEALGVDGSKPIYRGGRWVSASQ